MSHRARKRFGQHFLADPHYVDRIVSAIRPVPGDAMVEIGPGLGVLTRPLLDAVGALHVIEIDRDLCARLAADFAGQGLVIHQADALRFDFSALPSPLRVVGNLPYNISTPLLFRVGEVAERVRDCHFMLQKEVVDRMVGEPSGADYGRLSVMLQYRFAMAKLFEVPPGAFRPPPQVVSAVVRMVPRPAGERLARDERLFAAVVTAAFTRRRKTLRNALAGVADASQLERAGVNPGARPENLSPADYVAIANVCAASAGDGRGQPRAP